MFVLGPERDVWNPFAAKKLGSPPAHVGFRLGSENDRTALDRLTHERVDVVARPGDFDRRALRQSNVATGHTGKADARFAQRTGRGQLLSAGLYTRCFCELHVELRTKAIARPRRAHFDQLPRELALLGRKVHRELRAAHLDRRGQNVDCDLPLDRRELRRRCADFDIGQCESSAALATDLECLR